MASSPAPILGNNPFQTPPSAQTPKPVPPATPRVLQQQANVFAGPPFTPPVGYTFQNQPVPLQCARWFSDYGSANRMLTQLLMLLQGIGATDISLSIVDGIQQGYLYGYAPNAPTPYTNTEQGMWAITGNFNHPVYGPSFLCELAGDLIYRQQYPDTSAGIGDANYTQVGHGADARQVAVPGKLELVADTAYSPVEIHARWVAA